MSTAKFTIIPWQQLANSRLTHLHTNIFYLHIYLRLTVMKCTWEIHNSFQCIQDTWRSQWQCQHYSKRTCLILAGLLKHMKHWDLLKVEWLQVTSLLGATRLGTAAAAMIRFNTTRLPLANTSMDDVIHTIAYHYYGMVMCHIMNQNITTTRKDQWRRLQHVAWSNKSLWVYVQKYVLKVKLVP